MSDWTAVAVAAVTALGSAPLWQYVSRRFGAGQSEIARVRADLATMDGKHADCEEKLAELGARMAVIESHHASHFARWISDHHRRILYVNAKAIISIFGPMGISRDEIEGKSFRDLVDPGAADEVDRLAQAALAQDGKAVSSLIRLHPDLPAMHIVKVCAAGRDGELIYEAIAFRTNEPEVATALGIIRTAQQRAGSIDNLAGGAA